MVLTLGEASRQTGKSKSGIVKAIKSGRLSASKTDNGDWRIDPAELFRVYPPVGAPESEQSAERIPAVGTELAILRDRLANMDQTHARERDMLSRQIEDLRRRLDQSEQERREQARQLTALLTDQRATKTADEDAATPSRLPERPTGWRGFLLRLAG